MTKRLTLRAAVTVVSLLAATSASAQEQPPSPSPTPADTTGGPASYFSLAPRRRVPQSSPFAVLRQRPSNSPSGELDREPRVVCGMTLLPGNPAIDPGISARVSPPDASPTIRAVEPPMCWDKTPKR